MIAGTLGQFASVRLQLLRRPQSPWQVTVANQWRRHDHRRGARRFGRRTQDLARDRTFVWADAGGERLAAKVVDGKVVRFSVDELSPFMVFDRTPASRSSAWLLPALYASLAALLLTALLWPVNALVRRRYKAELAIEGADRKAFRWVRIGAVAALAVLAGWFGLVSLVSSDLVWLSSKIDPWLWTLQILSLVAFFGLLGTALWNAWRVWKGKRRWTSKVWSIVLVASARTVLLGGAALKLIDFGTDF